MKLGIPCPDGYSACVKMCQGGKAPDWMTHPEKARASAESGMMKDDIIKWTNGKRNPLEIPVQGHKRRKRVAWSCITCENSKDGEPSSYIIS